jgi:predicted kinase
VPIAETSLASPPVKARLVVMRGLPGSGKSTLAKAWVAADPRWRARVNRDDLRGMCHDGVWLAPQMADASTWADVQTPHLEVQPGTEPIIVAVRDAAIQTLLGLGVSVVCDDTNLPGAVVDELLTLAAEAGAGYSVHDLRGVALGVCLDRVAARAAAGGRRVPEAVIRDMWREHVAAPGLVIPVPPPGGIE